MPEAIKHKHSGFTLVELVIVIILLGVVGTFSSRFISDNVILYQMSVNQNERLNDARFVLNRMSKELDSAIAFSAKVESDCMSFAPFTAAGQYLNSAAGQVSIDLIMDPLTRSGSRAVSTFINQRLSVHSLIADDFYQAASGSIATINSYVASGANGTQAQIGLDSVLGMDSSVSRYFIFEREIRYCLETQKTELYRYDKIGNGTETRTLMMSNLGSGSSMTLTSASQFSNAILALNFDFRLRDGSEIKFEHQVVMTNVP